MRAGYSIAAFDSVSLYVRGENHAKNIILKSHEQSNQKWNSQVFVVSLISMSCANLKCVARCVTYNYILNAHAWGSVSYYALLLVNFLTTRMRTVTTLPTSLQITVTIRR